MPRTKSTHQKIRLRIVVNPLVNSAALSLAAKLKQDLREFAEDALRERCLRFGVDPFSFDQLKPT